MEWKEHVGWIAPIAASVVAFLVVTYGKQLANDRKIRRAIMNDDALSTYAKNIKIITIDGKVTLRGPVKNAEELNTIQSIARQAGVTSLDSQLEVKTTNQ